MASDLPASLRAALDARSSTRGFLPEPLPRATLDAIVGAAQRAPSWCNTQPWRVWITEPPTTNALRQAMTAAATSTLPHPDLPFPTDYPSPYQEHRRGCGMGLYQAMNIERDDKAGRHGAWLRNFAFFDAPHLAVVACDRRLLPYALIDIGVWLGYLFAQAAAMSVGTCAMASIATYPDVLRDGLTIDPELAILFGIALGRPDPQVPANACRTSRGAIEANVTYR